MEQKDKQLIVFLAGEIRDKQRIRSLLSNNEWDIFAADAGYKYALEFNALPKLVFGDFDSMNKPELDDLLIFPCEKDQTDSELALDLAAKHHYKKVMFIAPFGGRIDHTLANLNLLKKASGAGIDLQLYDGENLVFILPRGMHHPATTYRYISFIPMEDHTVISLEGFKYPLLQKELPTDSTLGISNETNSANPLITVHRGSVLCICIEKQQEEL